MKQPLTHIHPSAKIASNVLIDPFVFIDRNVEIGEGTWIGSNVTIMEGTRIGINCKIFPGAVVGAIPQDLKFKGEETLAIIGDNTTLRECVTVNRGTAARSKTIIGNNCLIMAYCHVAHDCVVGNNVIMGNTTQLADEVVIDDFAILSGGVLVHQFTHIGSHVIIQGGSRVVKDVPPYITAGRDPLSYAGINSIGLPRRGFINKQIQDIQEVYRYIFFKGLNISHATDRVRSEMAESRERNEILLFIRNSQRGILKSYFDKNIM